MDMASMVMVVGGCLYTAVLPAQKLILALGSEL